MAFHDTPRSSPLDTVFAALADPTRRAILSMLLEDDMAVTDVAEPFEMSLAAISKHLTILAAAGLISQEKRGRVKWCKLEPDALKAASVWMQGFGQFEPVNLDAFEAFLERELGDDGDPAHPDAAQTREGSSKILRPHANSHLHDR
jgi:DNA-binding transcriptional ArsR family regulator